MAELDMFINRDEFHFASVMIPVVERDGVPHLLFEIRGENLSQPGEICFPGGRVEADESPLAAAVREAEEELLISPGQLADISFVGILPMSSQLIIYAYTAELRDYKDTFSRSEVSEILLIPLSFFMEAKPKLAYCSVQITPEEDFPFSMIPGGKEYQWRRGKYPVFFYQYERHIVWGLTAKILKEWISRKQKGPRDSQSPESFGP